MATRVALITPPLDASGGIGRLMSYVLTASPREKVAVRVLDTRGHSSKPILSVIPLTRAWITLILLALSRQVDLAHINLSSHGSSVRKPIMAWTCSLLRIPVILHLHASEYEQFFDQLPQLAKTLLRRTFGSAKTVIVLGEHYREYACQELRVPEQNVTVLLNGCPGPSVAPTIAPRGSDPLRIVFLGRLGSRKGVSEALTALADPLLASESWVATFAGDGDIRLYEREAKALGIAKRVSFCGWVDTKHASALLRESHLLLLPSHAEGLPMSVVEAFANGVPVISTPVGAIRDIVQDRVNGLLVTPGDTSALATALHSLITDETLRLRLAAEARRTWEERLDITSYAAQLTSCWHATAKQPERSERPGPPPERPQQPERSQLPGPRERSEPERLEPPEQSEPGQPERPGPPPKRPQQSERSAPSR
jgi:glycosyltransferase involved in cell wall biosynthesis